MSDFAHVTDVALQNLLECRTLGPEHFRHAMEATARVAVLGLTYQLDAHVPLDLIHTRYEIAMDAKNAYDAGDYIACLAHLQKYWLT